MRLTERAGRSDDLCSEAAMEDLKKRRLFLDKKQLRM